MIDRPPLTDAEIQRRRRHVEVAMTESRLEGGSEPSAALRAVFEAYIRGEIEAADLVEAYQAGRFKPRCG